MSKKALGTAVTTGPMLGTTALIYVTWITVKGHGLVSKMGRGKSTDLRHTGHSLSCPPVCMGLQIFFYFPYCVAVKTTASNISMFSGPLVQLFHVETPQ